MLKNLSTTYDCKSGGTPGGLAFLNKKTKKRAKASQNNAFALLLYILYKIYSKPATPLGVPADLKSAVKKVRPIKTGGFVIPQQRKSILLCCGLQIRRA